MMEDEIRNRNTIINDDHENPDRSRYFYDLTISETIEKSKDQSLKTLKTFTGVFCPVALAQFSTLLFLRAGFVVGQTGLILTFIQLLLAYSILILTILSICAISTNGAIKGGGVYFMISRTLGPEFGGSIGIMFYLGNVFSSALYMSGFVEGLVNNFGPDGNLVTGHIPDGTWYRYLYATCVCVLCLAVCMIGSAMFAKTSLVIFIIVMICFGSVLVTFLAHPFMSVVIPHGNQIIYPPQNNSTDVFANFTGLSWQTLKSNIIYKSFKIDYTTLKKGDFLTVFAILFAGVTGIMNGANMSGELKNPSKSIPFGTFFATVFTLICYLITALLTAATCERTLLVNDYLYMQGINYWPPFIIIGIFSTTLSAALGNLIGASRILQALANDEIFGILLRPAKIVTKGGNPIVSVVVTFILVQLVLIIGQVNLIAPAVSVFFLLAYASVNLACALLDLASASNFRPHFKYFTWYSCLLGMVACLIMCFMINFKYAIGLFILFIALIIVLQFRHMDHAWGSIGQALIYHQVRKYLLLLDNRKDHVKYWRPQVLLLMSNPRSQASLVSFLNSLKKGGLFVLGHVIRGDFESMPIDPSNEMRRNFLEVKDYLNVKAFVDITVASTIREGCRHLTKLGGLGGMAINTVCLGFRDNSEPLDLLRIMEDNKKPSSNFHPGRWLPFSKLRSNMNARSQIPTTSSTIVRIDENSNHYGATDENSNSLDNRSVGSLDPEPSNEIIDSGDNNQLVKNNNKNSKYSLFANIKMKKIEPKSKFLDELPKIRLSTPNRSAMTRCSSSEAILESVKQESIGIGAGEAGDAPLITMTSDNDDQLSEMEYIGIIEDCIKLQKNICLCRHFDKFGLNSLHRQSGARVHYLDVWPINFFQPGSGSYLDNSCKLMLQLSCILRMSPNWSSRLKIRVFICLDYYFNSAANTLDVGTNIEDLWRELLTQWRIPAEICTVQWDDVVLNLEQDLGRKLLTTITNDSSNCDTNNRTISQFDPNLPNKYIREVNSLVKSRTNRDTSVCFFYLPMLLPSTNKQHFLKQLTLLTDDLPPSLLVRGQQEVMTVAI